MSACPRCTLLTEDWCGWAQPAEGDAVSMDRRANWARGGGSNHQAGVPLRFLSSFCFRSYADFPQWWRPESWKFSLSAPKLLLVIVFTTAARKQTRAVAIPASRGAGDRTRTWCSAAPYPVACALSFNGIVLEVFLKHQLVTLSISSVARLPFFPLIYFSHIAFFFLWAYSSISLKFIPWIVTTLIWEHCQKWKVNICFKLY